MIFKKFGKMDVSFLPIGAYEPRWFMKQHHMNPEDAVNAHIDLHSQNSIGIHFGTFQLTDEGIDEPVHELKRQLEKFKVESRKFITLKNGESVNY
jgi:L-ascorbate metabolism protein UlaG (beta-lactamase superfamily)